MSLREAWLKESGHLCQRCPLHAVQDVGAFSPMDYPVAAAMMDGPKRIYINDDLVCNLHCWTCREHTTGHSSNRAQQEATTRRMVQEFLPYANWLSLLHCGELFASQYHVSILQEIDPKLYPALRIEVFTNGTLLPRRWKDIRNVHSAIYQITMSIDAATKETYEQVRTPAKWEQLQEALQFVATLRKSGQVAKFQCNFVVRRVNYKEIPAFAEMCLEKEATRVRYAIYDKTWQSEDAYRSEIPYQEQAFKEILEHPILSRPEIDIASLRAVVAGLVFQA